MKSILYSLHKNHFKLTINKLVKKVLLSNKLIFERILLRNMNKYLKNINISLYQIVQCLLYM